MPKILVISDQEKEQDPGLSARRKESRSSELESTQENLRKARAEDKKDFILRVESLFHKFLFDLNKAKKRPEEQRVTRTVQYLQEESKAWSTALRAFVRKLTASRRPRVEEHS